MIYLLDCYVVTLFQIELGPRFTRPARVECTFTNSIINYFLQKTYVDCLIFGQLFLDGKTLQMLFVESKFFNEKLAFFVFLLTFNRLFDPCQGT